MPGDTFWYWMKKKQLEWASRISSSLRVIIKCENDPFFVFFTSTELRLHFVFVTKDVQLGQGLPSLSLVPAIVEISILTHNLEMVFQAAVDPMRDPHPQLLVKLSTHVIRKSQRHPKVSFYDNILDVVTCHGVLAQITVENCLWAMAMVESPENPRWLPHCVTYICHYTCACVALWEVHL